MKTIKRISRCAVSVFLICMFCINGSIISFAQSEIKDVPEPKATLKIVDSSNEVQEIQLEDSNVTTMTTRSANNVYTTVATVTIDNETLNKLLRIPASAYQGGDIALTAGMNYQVSGNQVSMQSVFGSYIPSGSFYATDRRVDWAHSAGMYRGQAYPGSNDWYYTTNSTYLDWNSYLAPYVRSECKINVSGMGGTGYNSVQFNLNL